MRRIVTMRGLLGAALSMAVVLALDVMLLDWAPRDTALCATGAGVMWLQVLIWSQRVQR